MRIGIDSAYAVRYNKTVRTAYAEVRVSGTGKLHTGSSKPSCRSGACAAESKLGRKGTGIPCPLHRQTLLGAFFYSIRKLRKAGNRTEKTMERYSVIEEKNKREIVLLRGLGCVYRKCTFCDYYSDSSENMQENDALNREVLSKVSGKYGDLEVINSGSVFELGQATLREIKRVCSEKGVRTLHFEAHYLYRNRIPELKRFFEGCDVKMKLGLETFDYEFRESVLKKGIAEREPAVIAEAFEEANFLFGVAGQTPESMQSDIELGLRYFERICINLMCGNSTAVQPDAEVIRSFTEHLYPIYRDDPRVDILLNNTDFGVGD